jgi:hypothetical protein
MIFHSQRFVAGRAVSVLCRFSHNSKMAAMPTTAKSGTGGEFKRAAIIIVGDEILKGETQVFTTAAIMANGKKAETLSSERGNKMQEFFVQCIFFWEKFG